MAPPKKDGVKNSRLGGYQIRSGRFVGKIVVLPPSRIDPRFLGHEACNLASRRITVFFLFLLQDQIYSGIMPSFYISCFHCHVKLSVVRLAGAINQSHFVVVP
jgi:hypothetical protein